MANNVLVMRNELEAYMKVSNAYSLIGEGFTDWSESKNPKEYTRQYVHEAHERTDVIGFSPSISYSADVYSDDDVISEIVAITDVEAKGTDAHRTICVVHKWQPVEGQAGCFVAYERDYAVIPDAAGDGTDALVYTGNLKVCGGAAVKGVFDSADNSFTADTPSAKAVMGELDITSAIGSGATNTSVITVADALGDGNHHVYKLGTAAYTEVAYGQPLNTGWTAFTSGAVLACGTSTKITVCEVTAANTAVKRGIAVLAKHS